MVREMISQKTRPNKEGNAKSLVIAIYKLHGELISLKKKP